MGHGKARKKEKKKGLDKKDRGALCLGHFKLVLGEQIGQGR